MLLLIRRNRKVILSIVKNRIYFLLYTSKMIRKYFQICNTNSIKIHILSLDHNVTYSCTIMIIYVLVSRVIWIIKERWNKKTNINIFRRSSNTTHYIHVTHPLMRVMYVSVLFDTFTSSWTIKESTCILISL